MVGCPAGCAFCATGRARLRSQPHARRDRRAAAGRRLARGLRAPRAPQRGADGHGGGAAELRRRARRDPHLDRPRRAGMSPRRITLSTVGLPARIRRLAGEGLPLVLAVSLHAPDEATRRRIIPTAHAARARRHRRVAARLAGRGGRRVTIEYTMLDGVNDAPRRRGAGAAARRAHRPREPDPLQPVARRRASRPPARACRLPGRARARRRVDVGAVLARPRHRRRLRSARAARRGTRHPIAVTAWGIGSGTAPISHGPDVPAVK
jgi:hypothetical protein